MRKIILIATLLIFTGCSNDEKKDTSMDTATKTVKKEVKQLQQKPKSKVLNEIKDSKKEETKKELLVVQEKIEEIKKEEPKKVIKAKKSGAEVFKACVACHGKNAEKIALNKSKIIRGWDASKVSAALNGYKDGTYGGAMKALMIGQVGFLTDEEVRSVSEYISKL